MSIIWWGNPTTQQTWTGRRRDQDFAMRISRAVRCSTYLKALSDSLHVSQPSPSIDDNVLYLNRSAQSRHSASGPKLSKILDEQYTPIMLIGGHGSPSQKRSLVAGQSAERYDAVFFRFLSLTQYPSEKGRLLGFWWLGQALGSVT